MSPIVTDNCTFTGLQCFNFKLSLNVNRVRDPECYENVCGKKNSEVTNCT